MGCGMVGIVENVRIVGIVENENERVRAESPIQFRILRAVQ